MWLAVMLHFGLYIHDFSSLQFMPIESGKCPAVSKKYKRNTLVNIKCHKKKQDKKVAFIK
jgi:hypothetical protein